MLLPGPAALFLTSQHRYGQVEITSMEAYSNPGLRLKFHIHLAASTILIEHIYTKFATAIRIALALGLACRIRPNRKFPCTPAELAIGGSLWIAVPRFEPAS